VLYIFAEDVPAACERMYHAIGLLREDRGWDYENVLVAPRLVASDEGRKAVLEHSAEATEILRMNRDADKPQFIAVIDGHS